MKSKISFLSITVLSVILMSCSKDEDVVTTPPAVVIPPPSVVTPPVTQPEASVTPSYDGGDISISSKEDLDYYREINVQNITGDFELNLDWTYVDNSTLDPSVFTKNIETVTGDVSINVSTNEQVSLENLVRVGGNYSITGHDVDDENLLYAKTISLDYDDDYEILALYTDQIQLNLSDTQTAKSNSSSGKGVLLSIDIHAYHTSLLADTDFTPANLPPIRTTEPVLNPDQNISYPNVIQSLDASGTTIVTEKIGYITMRGHTSIVKIISNSLKELNVLNTRLDSFTVISTSLASFTMPNLTSIKNLTIDVKGLNEFLAPKLVEISGVFSCSGISQVTMNSLTSVGTLQILSGYRVDLPVLTSVTTSEISASVRVSSTPSSGVAQANSGGGTSSSGGGSPPPSDEHNSGGNHDSGGNHNSGGSGG